MTEDFKLDDVALSVICPPHEGTPILRTRAQVERTLALIVEARALVASTTRLDDEVSGRIEDVQSGILEFADDAIDTLGGLLHQRGPYITIGFVKNDPEAILPMDREREQRQREANERLMQTPESRWS